MDLIEEGNISLLTSPPTTRRPVRDRVTKQMKDPVASWIAMQTNNMASCPRDLMETCLQALQALPSEDKEQEDIAKAAAADAFWNLGSMQFQPVLMDSYRRFVLVTGKKDILNDTLVSDLRAMRHWQFANVRGSLNSSTSMILTLETTCSEIRCEVLVFRLSSVCC